MPVGTDAVEVNRWDVTNEAYHQDSTSFSNSSLVIARRSLKEWEWTYLLDRMPKKKSVAMDFGTAFHYHLLEPQLFDRHFAIRPTHYNGPDGPDKIRWGQPAERHKAYCDKWFASNIGRIAIKDADVQRLQYMEEAVRESAIANELIFTDPGDAEYSCKALEPETGMWIKARFDRVIWQKDRIVNLKSARQVDLWFFRREIKNRNYDGGAALACAVYDILFGVYPEHIFVVVQNEPPHECEVYDLKDVPLGRAHERNIDTLNRLKAVQAVSIDTLSAYRSRTHGELVSIDSLR